jgi:phage tail-like protein
MAGEAPHSALPHPTFHFSVKFGDEDPVDFQELDGLDGEAAPIEYRHGNSPVFFPIKMPGLGRVGNVTMRKGVVGNDSKLWTWFRESEMNAIERRTVVISLFDESGSPKMVWTLNNAWPTQIASADIQSEGNEVAVESLEIAFETFSAAVP